MIVVILLLLSCGLALFLLVHRGVKGPGKTLDELIVPIEDLLKRGYDGGILLIDISHTDYFIQLRKYIARPGNYGIEVCFPNSDWSRHFFRKLEKLCKREGIKYEITEKTHISPVEFLCIDFGKDSHAAHEFVKKIILEIFGMDNKVTLFVKLENATIENKLIGR